MQPKQYSMVWMAWCINTSAASNTYRQIKEQLKRLHKNHKSPFTNSFLWITLLKFLPYLLFSRSSLHLPLTSVDGDVVGHQRTSVFLLMLQRIRNVSENMPTVKKDKKVKVSATLTLTAWRLLFLNVIYLYMGFPSRRTGTEHRASTTRIFCTIVYTWKVKETLLFLQVVSPFTTNHFPKDGHRFCFLFPPFRHSLVSIHISTVWKMNLQKP